MRPQFDVNSTTADVVSAFREEAKSKNIVITGGSEQSLGAEIALTLAKLANPHHIVLAGRSKDRIQPVIDQIEKINASIKADWVNLDLCSNESVKKGSKEISGMVETIDILVNGAGIGTTREHQLTVDGVEKQFAANHLGHFLLTNLLLPKLVEAKGRVVNVTSMAYTVGEFDREDPFFQNGRAYSPWAAYGQSKTANILFTWGFKDYVSDDGVTCLAVDPGMLTETRFETNNGIDDALMKEGWELATERNSGTPPDAHHVSLDQGCACVLMAALDPELKGKRPFMIHECQIFHHLLPYATDEQIANELWEKSKSWTGL